MQILVVSPELAGIAAVQLGVEVIDGDMISDGIVVDDLDHRPCISAPAAAQEDQIGAVLLQQPRQLPIGNRLNINLFVRCEDLLLRFLIIGKPDIIRTAEAAELRFGSCVKYAFPENGLVFVNGLRVLDIVRDKVVPHLHKFKARHDGSGIAVGIGVVPVVQEEEGDLNLGDCDLLTVRIGVGDRGLGIHPILHKVVEVYKIICHQLAIQVIVETAGKHSAL